MIREAAGYKYLAIYEVETDDLAGRAAKILRARGGTPKLWRASASNENWAPSVFSPMLLQREKKVRARKGGEDRVYEWEVVNEERIKRVGMQRVVSIDKREGRGEGGVGRGGGRGGGKSPPHS